MTPARAVAAAVIVVLAACSRQPANAGSPGAPQRPEGAGLAVAHGGTAAPQAAPGGSQASGTAGAAAGVAWTVPARWVAEGERPMRIATYTLPAEKGASGPGECAAFYFGPNQGGGVEANIARWASQFEGSPEPAMASREVAGLKVALVDLSGTYLAPGGPAMQSQASKPGWRLVGAIVEAPAGPVFFKCTGPDATVKAAKAELDALVASLHRL